MLLLKTVLIQSLPLLFFVRHTVFNPPPPPEDALKSHNVSKFRERRKRIDIISLLDTQDYESPAFSLGTVGKPRGAAPHVKTAKANSIFQPRFLTPQVIFMQA